MLSYLSDSLPAVLIHALCLPFLYFSLILSIFPTYPSLNLFPRTLRCLFFSSPSTITRFFHCDLFTSVFVFCPYAGSLLLFTVSHTVSQFTTTPSRLFPSSQSFFLSLHRDVRRLVVAMSRARLGLYIFARVSLFQNCFELTPAFNQLTARPLQLHIRPHEYYNQEQPVSSHTHAHADLIKPTILDLPHYEIFKWEIC